MARNRIKVRGEFVDSTLNYKGVVLNEHRPIICSRKFDGDTGDFPYPFTTMTREEFDAHNFMRALWKLISIHLPSDAELDVSRRFLSFRKDMYKRLHKINRKALIAQSHSVEVIA